VIHQTHSQPKLIFTFPLNQKYFKFCRFHLESGKKTLENWCLLALFRPKWTKFELLDVYLPVGIGSETTSAVCNSTILNEQQQQTLHSYLHTQITDLYDLVSCWSSQINSWSDLCREVNFSATLDDSLRSSARYARSFSFFLLGHRLHLPYLQIV